MINPVRFIPSIKSLQDDDRFQSMLETYSISSSYLTLLLKKSVDQHRQNMLENPSSYQQQTQQELVSMIFDYLNQEVLVLTENNPKSVINATGTILHTNLGRARLSDHAVNHIINIAKSYSNLEYDLIKGERGSRYHHVEELLKEITGAEAAMVVNNNAAAVFLILRAFAKHREVIVSRGELVEIGGSFRISSIMEESDASLIEVGTTNKTHFKDYEQAVNEQTAMVMKVHQSNFGMFGFTSSVARKTLIKLAQENNVIFYEDLGSGAFFDFKSNGIGNEPVVSDIISEGVDIISCSGDKLLGGPQVGIILGKKTYIDILKKHQLARTLRIDKMTLAALQATLKDYLSPETLKNSNPTIRDMLTPVSALLDRAEMILNRLDSIKNIQCKIINTDAQVGGGTMPGVQLSSIAIALKHKSVPSHEIGKRLRMNTPAVISRVQDDWVLLDFRTITDLEIKELEVILPDVMWSLDKTIF